jgi:hypothetical protein
LTDDESRTKQYVPYEEFRPVKATVDRHETVLFGIWDNGIRVKGILEQAADSTKALTDLTDSIESVKHQVTTVAWSIGKPVLILLGILVVVGFAAVVASGYSILHPDVLHSVTGR